MVRAWAESMGLGRTLVGSATAALTLGLLAPSAAQPLVAARTAGFEEFSQQAQSLRRRSTALAAETAALGAAATAQARAQALRETALRLARAAALDAEAAAETAAQKARADTEALERLVTEAWFARAAGSPPTAQQAIRLAAQHAAAQRSPNLAAADAAQAIAARRRDAATRLASQTEWGATRLADASQQLRARSEDHVAILDRLALAEGRARSLQRDPSARGRPAPRMAAALFGAEGARTVLGATEERPGVVYAGAPGQLVVCPEEGHIAFLGPLRGYGQVLIVAFDSGYHLVFSGLEAIQVAAGDRVGAGSVLGAFSQSAAVQPELYVEVRRASRPVDPERAARSWSVASLDTRVQGAAVEGRP